MINNPEEFCKKVINIIKDVAGFISEQRLNISGKDIELKGLHNFVTYVDKQSEEKLITALQKLLPDSTFIVEEESIESKSGDYTWIIDPLDGTTNFIHRLSPIAISVALQEFGKTILGIVYEISLDECFYAWKDSDAFLNGKKISVSETGILENSLIATGFPYYEYNRIGNFLETLKYFMENSHGIRRLGSAATDLAYVACGRFEAFYEYSLSSWDVAAGSFIIERAGGKVCDFSGGKNYIHGKEIIASNSLVFNEFYTIINKIMMADKKK